MKYFFDITGAKVEKRSEGQKVSGLKVQTICELRAGKVFGCLIGDLRIASGEIIAMFDLRMEKAFGFAIFEV